MIHGDWVITYVRMDNHTPSADFAGTGLAPEILAVLPTLGYTAPTPIQAETIPVALQGSDVIGIAQTGTGKTLAFGLAVINLLLKQEGKGVIIVPTRELALQVEESIRKITRLLAPPIRTVCLIGGMPMYRQIKDLRYNPRIIIATPGRLQDHLRQRTLQLNDVLITVLDEADRMFDMGFAPQVQELFESLPKTRQTLLFSATMAPEVSRLATTYMHTPVRVEVATNHEATRAIAQELCYVPHRSKSEVLAKVLTEHRGTVLVFTRTKLGAGEVAGRVQALGHTAAEMHSNLNLGQRKRALEGFKQGAYRVLVATDVAARGIDVQDISLVVNYDLPETAADYVHRIGRTGRAGKTGRAITFASPEQQRMVRSIEQFTKQPITLSVHSSAQPAYSGGGAAFSRSSSRFSRPASRPYRPAQSNFRGNRSSR